jgi:hypothetical protein
MNGRSSSFPWPQFFLAVSLTTLATLLLELALTRIFSVVFYYHFAFLAISIALFGLGAGGVFSYVVGEWKGALFHKLGLLSAATSALVVVALVVALAQHEEPGYGALALIYFVTALPFFGAGTVVSLAIGATVERVDRVYFFDLLGAAGGCALLIPLLNLFGGPHTVVCAAVLFAVAAALWHSMAGSVAGRAGSVALALALVAFLILNQTHRWVDIKYAKGQRLRQESFVKWNSFSRIAVAPERDSGRPMIFIDADASTAIADFDFERLADSDRQGMLRQGPGLPYVLRPGARTLIIGPGGGWDVARALASGSRDVTGVEINPIIATTIMRERLSGLSRGLYLRPEVHIEVEDGRSYVRRSAARYQVLQATLVDTWASTAAGAFALSENNLYTTDAFLEYLGHLTGDGLAAFTRWGFDPPRESLRLVSLAMEALARMGEGEPWRHVMVAREGAVEGWGALDTVLVARQPFTPADLESARAAIAAGRMEAIYLPGDAAAKNAFAALLRSPDPEQYQRAYRYDISPVGDNRPFFFYTVQPRDIGAFLAHASRASADYKVNKAVPLLFGLLAVSLVATALTLALPPLLLGARLPRHKGVRSFLLYFAFIGTGYILIEVALIQKFVLFLGHPTYALTVVIFSMLVSSGLGSFFSRRLLGGSEGRWVKALGLVALLAAALGVASSLVLPALVGLPLAARMALSVAMIAPLGFAMGTPFPTGLRKLEEWHAPSVRWAWSLNAAASVLGSVGALVCSIYLGLIQTLMVGGLLYVAALAVVSRLRTGAGPAQDPGRVMLAR